MNVKLHSEFARVFGSVHGNNESIGLMAEGWPEHVRYKAEKALPVLNKFPDLFGATEAGDSKVCTALFVAGAVS